jgi:hypothetical protein
VVEKRKVGDERAPLLVKGVVRLAGQSFISKGQLTAYFGHLLHNSRINQPLEGASRRMPHLHLNNALGTINCASCAPHECMRSSNRWRIPPGFRHHRSRRSRQAYILGRSQRSPSGGISERIVWSVWCPAPP